VDTLPIHDWVLSPTIASLEIAPRIAIDRLRRQGWRGVQLDARAVGTTPRELGESARRDLLSLLRRGNQLLTGLDCWIPDHGWKSSQTVHQAIDVMRSAIDLAGDLGRCAVSTILPAADEVDGGVLEAVFSHASSQGVRIADHRIDPVMVDAAHGAGIDPAAYLSAGSDPVRAIGAVENRLACVRLTDLDEAGHRMLPGTGTKGRLDLVAYKVAIVLRGWSGGVVVDLRRLPEPASALPGVWAAWNAADASPGDW
jgi:sugar phosphate isomerase/epimerase|tara:strand:+ start:2259 stop:3023 length:765 start_codon:yes stop_codon:yes gene_type:complete